MMIDRRTFVAGAVVAAAVPPLDLLVQPALPAAEASPVVFLVDGWSGQGEDATADQLWVRIDRGWRVSWR